MSFEELRAFVVVAEQGSFLSAAVTLGVSRTTLRRQVDALEAQAGVPLLQRDRSGVELTDAGRLLLRGGRVMEQEFITLLNSVRQRRDRPEGDVRVLMPVGLPPMLMQLLYAMFRASWPAVNVHLRFAESPLAASLADVDVVYWFGPGEPSRAWQCHEAFPLRHHLFASPAYLALRGTPRTVADLSSHELLAWLPPGSSEPHLVTTQGALLPLRPAITSTDVHLIHECAASGNGIAWAPDAGLPAPPDRPAMVPLLDDEIGYDASFMMAVPQALADVPKVRLFIENLAAFRAAAVRAADVGDPAGKPRRRS